MALQCNTISHWLGAYIHGMILLWEVHSQNVLHSTCMILEIFQYFLTSRYNLSDAKIGILQVSYSNTAVTDALAPCVAESATMAVSCSSRRDGVNYTQLPCVEKWEQMQICTSLSFHIHFRLRCCPCPIQCIYVYQDKFSKTSIVISFIDVNECTIPGKKPCGENSKCSNTIGGFTCQCDPYYQSRSGTHKDCERKLKRSGVGVTKAPFVNFSVSKILDLAKVHVRFIESHSYLTGVPSAAVTPVKYKRDI